MWDRAPHGLAALESGTPGNSNSGGDREIRASSDSEQVFCGIHVAAPLMFQAAVAALKLRIELLLQAVESVEHASVNLRIHGSLHPIFNAVERALR